MNTKYIPDYLKHFLSRNEISLILMTTYFKFGFWKNILFVFESDVILTKCILLINIYAKLCFKL